MFQFINASSSKARIPEFEIHLWFKGGFIRVFIASFECSLLQFADDAARLVSNSVKEAQQLLNIFIA